MRELLCRSLIAALLLGPVLTVAVHIASIPKISEYQPGLTEAETKAYDDRTVLDFEKFLESRRLRLTRYQSLREEMRYPSFWKGIAWGSIEPFIAVFLGCIIVGGAERRRTLRASTSAGG